MSADALAANLRRQATFNREANSIAVRALEQRGEPNLRALAALRHVFETELVWLRRLTGGDANVAQFPQLEAYETELATCHRWLTEASEGMERFAMELDDSRFDKAFEYHNLSGQPRSNFMSNVLQHVFLHSAQYRGEALGHLAVTGRVPDVDFIFYAGGEARFGRMPA